MVMKALVAKCLHLPSAHTGSHHRDPVDASGRIRHVAADVSKAPAAKQLTGTCHILLTLKAVARRVVATVFSKRSAAHTKCRIRDEFLDQKLHVGRLERHV